MVNHWSPLTHTLPSLYEHKQAGSSHTDDSNSKLIYAPRGISSLDVLAAASANICTEEITTAQKCISQKGYKVFKQ